MYRKSELNVSKGIKFVGALSHKLPLGLFQTNVCETRESYWYSLLTMLQWTNTTSIIST